MELARQATMEAESKSSAPDSKKPSAFEVALQTAQNIEDRRVEAKDAKSSGEGSGKSAAVNVAESKSDQQQIRGEGYRLLGDLPMLNKGSNSRDVQVALALELPGESTKRAPKMVIGGREVAAAAPSDSSIPSEFLCAINGHMMKDPVRCARTGERDSWALPLAHRKSMLIAAVFVCRGGVRKGYNRDLAEDPRPSLPHHS
jgi:hypothetical protein